MTDIVSQLVGALEASRAYIARYGYTGEQLAIIDAALTAAKAGGWVDLKYCLDGDAWFALSCGHVVRGYKSGLMLTWDEEADCCMDASVIKCHPITLPTPPKEQA